MVFLFIKIISTERDVDVLREPNSVSVRSTQHLGGCQRYDSKEKSAHQYCRRDSFQSKPREDTCFSSRRSCPPPTRVEGCWGSSLLISVNCLHSRSFSLMLSLAITHSSYYQAYAISCIIKMVREGRNRNILDIPPWQFGLSLLLS